MWNQWIFSIRRVPVRGLVAMGLLLVLAVPATAQDLEYRTSNGEILITGYTGAGGEVVVPDTIEDLPVTRILSSAFYSESSLTSIALPDSVNYIGDAAFASCSNLTAITVSVANPAFSSEDGVLFNAAKTVLVQFPGGRAGSYTIPGGVVNVGNNAFQGCTRLIEIVIPGSVANIGNFAFASCANLTNITIPEGVASIGNNAFKDCRSLTGITIPDSVTSIGIGVFWGCPNLTGISVPGSVASIGSNAFYSCTGLTNVVIGDGVTSIGFGAFAQCSSLTSVTIPDSITDIEGYAFSGCVSLPSVVIPDSVTSIGTPTFFNCSSLISIAVDANNFVYSSEGGVLFDKNKTTLVQCPGGLVGDYTVPDTVNRIGDNAFFACKRLTTITIPASVDEIGNAAFSSCTSLMSITVSASNSAYVSVDGVLFNADKTTLVQHPGGRSGEYLIPDGVINIGNNAFAGSLNLTSIVISDRVTGIGNFVFSSCTSLVSIIIPESVTALGKYTFLGCDNLTGVYFEGTTPTYGSAVFLGANRVNVFYLPGSTGWPETYGDRPTAVWQPRVQVDDGMFGVIENKFGFNVSWAKDLIVEVEACVDLSAAEPVWVVVGTVPLTDGLGYFSDSVWGDYPDRFYRLRMP